jgi:hypothetical protein
MSDQHLTPLPPDEALHAFMDGELEHAEEQRLFDELAANPELRSEMKDVLSIRGAVLHDLIAPPAAAETGMFSALGWQGAGAGAVVATATTGAGGFSGLGTSLFTLFSFAGGFILAWLLFRGVSDTTATNTTAVADGATQGTPAPMQVYVTTPVDTVYAVRVVRVREAVPQQVPLTTSDRSPSSTEVTTNAAPLATEDRPEADALISTTSTVPAFSTTSSAFVGNIGRDAKANKPGYLSPTASPYRAYVRMRSLASGLHADEPTPQSVQDAIIANGAAAVLWPINYHHRVGVEMGNESFRQEFTTVDPDGRTRAVLQTPVLYWMGGTYEYFSSDFSFLDGLSVFGTSSIGYAYSQGMVGRASVGLAYNPIGPLRFTVGLDASVLAYQHQTNWFSSNKWGMTYGISFDVP